MKNPLSLETLSGIFRTSPKDPSRIINREGTTIEFKESYNHSGMAQYFKTIASFSNNSGGYIIFGVGDKPRKLLGLNDKSLSQFESLNVEDFTNALLDYFAPEIKWDHCTFEFRDMSFGVIYTYPLSRKPCICKKSHDEKNPKYTLKEGDIYYRYGGRSERIRYGELSAIIDESRKNEERQWLDFAKRVARIGVSNAALLDLKSGTLSANSGSVIIDESLLEKIAFIREGKFVETGGKPTLRIIGDVTEISTGKIVVSEKTKKIVRAIEPNDIVQVFLQSQTVDEPAEYIKRICSASSANYPIYYYIQQAHLTISDALELVRSTTSRGAAKSKLIERLEGKVVPQSKPPVLSTNAGKKKSEYRTLWIEEALPDEIENMGYCMQAILCLSEQEISEHQQYINSRLKKIFDTEYEQASSVLASDIRKAICRVDEVLYLEK